MKQTESQTLEVKNIVIEIKEKNAILIRWNNSKDEATW